MVQGTGEPVGGRRKDTLMAERKRPSLPGARGQGEKPTAKVQALRRPVRGERGGTAPCDRSSDGDGVFHVQCGIACARCPECSRNNLDPQRRLNLGLVLPMFLQVLPCRSVLSVFRYRLESGRPGAFRQSAGAAGPRAEANENRRGLLVSTTEIPTPRFAR